jgi:3-phenylpropionate/cinnamic acid dioxygenase small subunit
MMQENLMRKIADELQIRNLISKLAMAGDEGTQEDYGSLFAEDATWRMTPIPGAQQTFSMRNGRADIVAGLNERRAAKTGGPGSHSRHGILQSVVEIDGDTARARTYLAYFVDLDKTPTVQLFAVYQDTFTRTAETWQLQSRDIEPA